MKLCPVCKKDMDRFNDVQEVSHYEVCYNVELYNEDTFACVCGESFDEFDDLSAHLMWDIENHILLAKAIGARFYE